jgi:hypothetical protein
MRDTSGPGSSSSVRGLNLDSLLALADFLGLFLLLYQRDDGGILA